MKIFTIVLIALLAVNFVYAGDIQFRVNMSVQASKGTFDPAGDKVFVRATFNTWGTTNPEDTLFDGDHDLIYTKTISLTAGDSIQFKFAFRDVSASSDVWESINNRRYTVPDTSGLYEDYFNRDSSYTPPAQLCPTTILQNGGFTSSMNSWTYAYGSPDYNYSDGCQDSGFVAMWGNQNQTALGEGIQQSVTFTAGNTYTISFCGKWAQQSNRPYVPRYEFRASNTPLIGPQDPNGTIIGISEQFNIEDTWIENVPFSWTPTQNYTILTINVTNQSSANHGDSVTYAYIDNVCITEQVNGDTTAYWQQTATIPSMSTYALAVGKYDTTEIVYVGTDSGVYRSSNEGTTWTQAGLMSTGVTSLAIDSSGNLFAGTGNAGVYISTDKGNNWSQTTLTGVGVNALIINPSGYIFAGTEGQGLYQSTLKDIDSMHQWTRIDTGWTNSFVYALTFDEYGRVYAGTNGGGVYIILPSGDSSGWTSRQLNTGMTNLNVLSLGANSNGSMFAGTNGGGLYRSTNYGVDWSQDGVAGSPELMRCIGIKDNGEVFIGADSGRTYQDTGNGDSWSQLTPMFSSIAQSFAFTTNGYVFVATANNGVYKSVQPSPVDYWQICADVYLDYGGSISSPGTTWVADGHRKTYYIQPLPGYHIDQVWAGPAQADQPCDYYSVSPVLGVINSYTFNNVTQNQRFSVHFAQDETGPNFWWLGTLRNDYQGFSDAWGVTNDGIVVGGSSDNTGNFGQFHSFLWTQAGTGTMTEIGTLPGGNYSLLKRLYVNTIGLQYYGIPKTIYAVGTSSIGQGMSANRHAFVSDLTFYPIGPTVFPINYDLGTLVGGNNSEGWGISGGNSTAKIVGSSSNGQYTKATEWIFDPYWSYNSSYAYTTGMLDGNNSCTYDCYEQSSHQYYRVGSSQTATGKYHAYISGYKPSGYLEDLGTLSPGGKSSANGWGGGGEVGYSNSSLGGYTAFWSNGSPSSMVPLGTLTNPNSGGSNAFNGGYDWYNYENFAVGMSNNSFGQGRATIWTWPDNETPDLSYNVTIKDLTDVYRIIVPTDTESWLQIARSASDNGQYIVGRGFHKVNGHWRLEAFLMKRW